jgi:capsular exopolysaccharide synthesis family protein
METISPNIPISNPAEEEEINYRRIISVLLGKWYWIAGCAATALVVTFLYLHYAHQSSYLVDTSILIMEDQKKLDLANMFENALMSGGSDVTIENEIELLRSFTLSHRAIERLNWRTSWSMKKFFTWVGLYPSEPFLVLENDNGGNLEGLDLYIEPLDEDRYRIYADGEAKLDNFGKIQDVRFSSEGRFGEPFRNDYFHFTLIRKDQTIPIEDQEYRFRFNNFSKLAKAYLKKEKIEQTGKKNDVIRLSIEGREPLREIHYLNQLVSEYIEQKLEVSTERNKRSLDFINKQLSGIADSLSAAGTTVTDFRTSNQVLDISAEGQIVLNQLSELEKEKSQSQIQYDYFQNLLRYLGNNDSIKKMVMPSVVGIQDPSLNAVVLKLTDLYSQREVLSFSTHETNPSMVLLNREIGQVAMQLRENLINLIDNARLTMKNLERRQNTINQQLNNLPKKEQRLINITRQYELTNEIYTFLLQKRAETEIAMASTTSEIQVVDAAQLDRIEPSGMSNKIFYLLALFLGCCIPGVIILGVDSLNNTIHFEEDVKKLTSLSIIGNVPHMNTNGSEFAVTENPRSPIAESYRTIRTNLQYLFSQNRKQVIGIHSISPGEGKSFSSINLACILALNDKKVLLIGADMRKPRLGKVFNVPINEGLSTYLIGQSAYKDAIQQTQIGNLWLMPAGPIPPNPAELLERDLFGILMEQARKDFDFIVIDNAPVSLVTDGLITGRLADLNIFILRYGMSRKDELKFINEMAAQGVMNHPALVINDIKANRYGGYYHSYSYSYSYRSKGYYGENGDGSNHQPRGRQLTAQAKELAEKLRE